MRSQGQRQRPKFTNPQYFDFLKDSKRWRCSICKSNALPAQNNEMTAQAALRHEKTPEHRERVRACDEWDPLPDEDVWNTNPDSEIDQLRDFIPYWRRTIEAAEYGKTLRFEDFLNALRSKKDKEKEEVVWDLPMPSWAIGPLETLDADHQPDGKDHHALHSDSSHDLDRDAFDFVEKIAGMASADQERRQRLHSFYKMPTNEKVKRIYELIDTIRTAHGTS